MKNPSRPDLMNPDLIVSRKWIRGIGRMYPMFVILLPEVILRPKIEHSLTC